MTGLRFGGVIGALVGALICVPGALSAQPSNDNFASPFVLAGEYGEHEGTNLEATKELGEPPHAGDAGGASVWFSWTAPRDGVLLVDTCDSDFDTLLAVYTGSSLDVLTEVEANDDACDLQSALELGVAAGTNYRLVVDGAGGDSGAVVLSYGMAPPNDDFAAAEVVAGASGTVTGSMRFASHELNEPLHAGLSGTGSIWYAWSASTDLRATFDVCGSGAGTFLAIYSGSSLTSLSLIGGDDDDCNERGRVEFDAFAGTTYWIAVDSDGYWDEAILRWATGPLFPRNLSPPTISGRPLTNTVLVASPGAWVHASSFFYHWEGCPDTPNPPPRTCKTIRPQPFDPYTQTLKVPTAVLGQRIRLQVTAQNSAGGSSAWSALIGPVTPGPPANISPPDIDGYPIIGETLKATEGNWDLGGAPRVGVTFLWQRCDANVENCRNIKGPSPDTKYLLTSADRGASIQIVVTMTTTAGSTIAAGVGTGIVTPPERTARQRRCVVPRLLGKRIFAARKVLSRARCRLGATRKVYSARKVGLIVRQRPKPGTRLRAGGKVTVFVSKGRRR